MKMTATFNETEDKQLQEMVNTFKAQGASVRIGGVNENGGVDLIIILAGCQLEGERGIELKGKLFEEAEAQRKAAEEAQKTETPAEPVEGEVVDKQ